MATRLAQIGWEQGLLEANFQYIPDSSNLGFVSTIKARTGLYALSTASAAPQPSYGKLIPSTTELRAYTSVNHNAVALSTSTVDRHAIFFHVLKADGTVWRFAWHRFNALFYILSTTTTIIASATDTTGGITPTNVWHDVSIAIKVHATTGWLKLYLNGVEVVSFTGNTGTSPVIAVAIGGCPGTAGGWTNYSYWDDLYIDDTTGEAASAAESRKFFYTTVNGNGASSQFTGNDGNSTDNYLLVDDVAANDSDATYVAAGSSGLVDSYTHTPFSIPADQTILALIPIAETRKTNAAIDTEAKVRISKGGNSDGSSTDLITQYTPLSNRFTALPDASTLNEANINLTEIAIVSGGAYV